MTIKLLRELSHFPVPPMCCIYWIDGPSNFKTAALQCPNCSRAFCLKNHNIDNISGQVSPSVVCPFGCGFHEFIQITS